MAIREIKKFANTRGLENAILTSILLFLYNIIFPIHDDFILSLINEVFVLLTLFFLYNYLQPLLESKTEFPLSMVLNAGILGAFLVNYSRMINGIERAAITKLDVLSYLKEIKVCVAYEINGKKLKSYPADANQMMKVQPIYESLPGWQKDISNITSYDALPSEAKEYLSFISQQSGFEISLISVGPRRQQTIEL